MKTPYFIEKIDWTYLRTQKTLLLQTINNDAVSPEHKEGLEGILALIDAVQDYAVDEMDLNPMHVFNFEEEDVRDGYTGITDIEPMSEEKTIYICTNCNSDNVQIQGWVKPNNGDEYAGETDEPMGWCCDEELHAVINTVQVKANAKVIGFQVVGEEGTPKEGEIHPMMDASFCLYNLSQAKEMLENETDWRLLTIWTGDVEEPAMMFKGNPRD